VHLRISRSTQVASETTEQQKVVTSLAFSGARLFGPALCFPMLAKMVKNFSTKWMAWRVRFAAHSSAGELLANFSLFLR